MSNDANRPTSSTVSDTDPRTYNPTRARAAFEALRGRIEAMPPPSRRGGVDTQGAALQALALVRRARSPELYPRFASLPPTEFKMENIDLLEQAAWATWYAHKEFERARSGSEAKLPLALVEEANLVEARMQACCEYYFSDDPELGPEVARLRAGVGYRDQAGDLLGYADIYDQRRDVVSQDRKYYRPTDRDDAIRIGERMIELIGEALGPAGQTASSVLGRTFELLRVVHRDVNETGLWLLRDDPERERKFPSLYVSRARSARPRQQPETPEQPA